MQVIPSIENNFENNSMCWKMFFKAFPIGVSAACYTVCMHSISKCYSISIGNMDYIATEIIDIYIYESFLPF